MADLIIVDTYEEAGEKLKDRNEGVQFSMSNEELGKLFYAKYPDRIRIREAEEVPLTDRLMGAAGQINEGLTNFINKGSDLVTSGELLDLPGRFWSGFDESAERIGRGLGGGAETLGKGIASGGTAGATKQAERLLNGSSWAGNDAPIRSPSIDRWETGAMPVDDSGMLYGAGEIMGETALFGGIGKKTAKTALGRMAESESLPIAKRLLAKGGMGALESMGMESVKALVRGDNPWDVAMPSLITGGVTGTLFPGIFAAGKHGMQKYLGPGEELDKKLIELYHKWEIPLLPRLLRPEDDLVAYTEWRTSMNAASKKIYKEAQQKLVRQLGKMRQSMEDYLGDGKRIGDPSEVGQRIMDDIASTEKTLYAAKTKAYTDLLDTPVADVPILPNKRFKTQFVLRDNEGVGQAIEFEGSIEEGLLRALKEYGINPKMPSSRMSPEARKVLGLYNDIRKNGARVQSVDEWVDYPIQPDRANQAVSAGRMEGKTPLEDVYVPGARRGQGKGEVVKKDQMVYLPYSWYWNEIQHLGNMAQKMNVTPKEKRLIGQAYHIIQDGMDNFAEMADPRYAPLVAKARGDNIAYRTFQEHPKVQAAMYWASDKGRRAADRDKILPDLFGKSADSIRRTKEIMSPEAFNEARQAWIRDVLSKSLDIDDTGGIRTVDSSQLIKRLHAYTDDIDSEFVREMFSDKGFVDAAGEAIDATTDAAKKYAQFREFYELSEGLTHAKRAMKATGKGDIVSTEQRIDPGMLVDRPARILSRLKGLAVSLMLGKKASKMFLEGIEDGTELQSNVFLGGGIGGLRDAMPRFAEAFPDAARRGGQTAIANRLLGTDR